MPRYRVQDDEVIEAKDAADLVQKLTNTSIMPVASTAAFRVRAAYWAQALFGTEIRTHSDDVFVEDMLKHDIYQIEPDR